MPDVVQSAAKQPLLPPAPPILRGGGTKTSAAVGGTKASSWSNKGQGGAGRGSNQEASEEQEKEPDLLAGDSASISRGNRRADMAQELSETLTIHAAISHIQGNSEARSLAPAELAEFQRLLGRGFTHHGSDHAGAVHLPGEPTPMHSLSAAQILYGALAEVGLPYAETGLNLDEQAFLESLHDDELDTEESHLPQISLIEGVGGQYWNAPEDVARMIITQLLPHLNESAEGQECGRALLPILQHQTARVDIGPLLAKPVHALHWLEAVLAIEREFEEQNAPIASNASLQNMHQLIAGLRILSKPPRGQL